MFSINSEIFRWLGQQFQLKPGKPAYIYGVRTLLILGGPIGIGIILGQPAASAIATMSALFVGMVNFNGTYRQQAQAMGAVTIGIASALLLANLVSSTLWLTLVTTFIVIFCLGLAGLYGATTAGMSLSISIMFIVSLARFSSFPNLVTVLEQCLLCLAGGLWAMVLSLGLWIVRPYTPALQSVANCYLSLSKLMDLAEERIFNPQDRQTWARQFLQSQDTVIQNLTNARSIWTSVWTRAKGDNPRGNQLLVLIEDANQILNSLIALVELIVIAAQSPWFIYLQREIGQTMEQVAFSLQKLSTAIAKERNSVDLGDLARTVEALEYQWQSLRSQVFAQTIEIQPNEYRDLVNLRKIITSLTSLSGQIHADADSVKDLSLKKPHNLIERDENLFIPSEHSSLLDKIKNNFTFRSVLFRHALRLALIVTIAQLVAFLLPIPRGYWITLTALVALKPNFGGTSQSTGQRVMGTIIGGMIGILLVVLIHNSIVTASLILLLMFTAMSVRSLSYSLFITLLTPAIILLLSVIGSGNWEIGVLRIVDSLIGGTLALLGSYLLFPSWERQQLPAQLEKTIRANLAYFQQAIAIYLSREYETFQPSLNQLRHQAALENANAEAAAQRLFSEPRHVQGEIEPVMTLMLYIRSLFSSVTTLTEHLQEFGGTYQFTDIQQLANEIEEVLINLADALHQRQTPQPLPPLDNYLESICDRIERLHNARISEITTHLDTTTPTLQAVREQTPVATVLHRIVRAVKIMHCAISRMEATEA